MIQRFDVNKTRVRGGVGAGCSGVVRIVVVLLSTYQQQKITAYNNKKLMLQIDDVECEKQITQR